VNKLFVIGAAIVAAGLLAGCGHNAINYGDGLGFDMGVNPENYTMSFNLRYGKILSAVTRDNVEIAVTGKADANGTTGTEKSATGSVGTDGGLRVKIGRQINGAAVDLVKAGADADKVLKTLDGDITDPDKETVVATEAKTEPATEKTTTETKTKEEK